MMTKCLLLYELISIFAPSEVKVDPYEYIKTKGCAPWMAYVSPSGFACEQERYFNYMYLSINRRRQDDLQSI